MKFYRIPYSVPNCFKIKVGFHIIVIIWKNIFGRSINAQNVSQYDFLYAMYKLPAFTPTNYKRPKRQ